VPHYTLVLLMEGSAIHAAWSPPTQNRAAKGVMVASPPGELVIRATDLILTVS